MAYLDVTGINACISYLGSAYPSMVQVITVPEPSREGTTIRAFRLGANSAGDRRAVLVIGGVHARELVNPDMLLSLSVKLCQSYSAGTGLTFGGKTFSAQDVKLVLDTLDVFVLPLVNPDGRAYVQSPAGYAMWRKNRAVLPGTSCRGVDLNRNCDFLWQYAIGQTSTIRAATPTTALRCSANLRSATCAGCSTPSSASIPSSTSTPTRSSSSTLGATTPPRPPTAHRTSSTRRGMVSAVRRVAMPNT